MQWQGMLLYYLTPHLKRSSHCRTLRPWPPAAVSGYPQAKRAGGGWSEAEGPKDNTACDPRL